MNRHVGSVLAIAVLTGFLSGCSVVKFEESSKVKMAQLSAKQGNTSATATKWKLGGDPNDDGYKKAKKYYITAQEKSVTVANYIKADMPTIFITHQVDADRLDPLIDQALAAHSEFTTEVPDFTKPMAVDPASIGAYLAIAKELHKWWQEFQKAQKSAVNEVVAPLQMLPWANLSATPIKTPGPIKDKVKIPEGGTPADR